METLEKAASPRGLISPRKSKRGVGVEACKKYESAKTEIASRSKANFMQETKLPFSTVTIEPSEY